VRSPRRGVRLVFFDAGGTLLRPWPSVGAVYSRAGAPFGLRASPAAIDAAFRDVWSESTARPADATSPLLTAGRDAWRGIVERVLDRVHFDGDRSGCFDACFEAFGRGDAWHVFPDARPALAALHARGVRTAVASNWDDRLPALLATLDLRSLFEPVVVSSIEGLSKPDPRFFLRACERAGVAPEEALHVGDQPALDRDGARAAGLAALLLDRSAGRSGTASIRSLLEIPRRLDAEPRRAAPD
jgi:putative hydrolase of the HAD superfamily